ncbi:hypothetical protein ACFFLM_26395 [Deinococcus oregonensis]|uniref:Uncharacterized protein n=1 Tax=Deinococcus oregonensis TaxID=1805970 RepID=A0ABV6BAM4_9DEIO
MKNIILAATLTLTGLAGAQSWQLDKGAFKLVACTGTPAGVQCDLTYTLTKQQSYKFGLSASEIKAYLADGTVVSPQLTTGGGQNFSTYGAFEAQYNVPVKATFLFNIPNTTSSLRALVIDDVRVDNVAVRGTAAAPASTPGAATSTLATGYNAVLTNCKSSAGGQLTCTATLTPRR